MLRGLFDGYHPIGKALPGASQVGWFVSNALGRARNRQDRGRGAPPLPPRCGGEGGFGSYGRLGATAKGLWAILGAAIGKRDLADLRHRITALPQELLSENNRSPRTSVLEQRLSGVAFGGRTVLLASCLEEVHAVDAALAVHPGLEDGKARQQGQLP